MSNSRRLRRSVRFHRDRPAAGVPGGHFDCGCSHLAVLSVTCPSCGHQMTTPPMPTSGSVGDLREMGAFCLACGVEFEALAVISALV